MKRISWADGTQQLSNRATEQPPHHSHPLEMKNATITTFTMAIGRNTFHPSF
jgi:hypothetical protein